MFIAIDVLLLLTAGVLLTASIIFSGDTAPKFFSRRIYLVETDAFSLVKNGSALITEQEDAENIAPGNIIIFSDDGDEIRIGEVREAKLDDGVYTFKVKNDLDEEMTIGQSHIMGKGIYYSDIIGMLVSFAMSPAGVCFIAVLPCAAFIILEIIASLKRKDVQAEFETVKKQDEIPTYLPRQEYVPPEDRPAFSYERERLMEEAGLFTPPRKASPPRQEEYVPISERDIDKLIKETRAKHLAGVGYSEIPPEPSRSVPPPQRNYPRNDLNPPARPAIFDEEDTRDMFEHPAEAPIEQRRPPEQRRAPEPSRRTEEEEIRRYDPPKKNPPKLAPRVSRLDSLLQEESDDSHYDIDDILKSIEKSK